MKKASLILTIIVIWQILIALFAISVIVVRAQNDEFLHNKHIYMDYETWSESTWRDVYWYPDYYQEFRDTEAVILSIYTLVVTPIAIVGCIGLLMRSNWGRRITILSMGMTLLFFLFQILCKSCKHYQSHLGFLCRS